MFKVYLVIEVYKDGITGFTFNEFKYKKDAVGYLKEFEIQLMKLAQNHTKIILDKDCDQDEVQPEEEPEAEGNVIYFTGYKEVVEDLESKTEAEKNFELREKFLEERKKEKPQVNQITELNRNNFPKNSRKRWWEFSK